MAKRKFKIASLSSVEIFQQKKQRFNGFQSGTGIHGDVKCNRNKEKRQVLKNIKQESV